MAEYGKFDYDKWQLDTYRYPKTKGEVDNTYTVEEVRLKELQAYKQGYREGYRDGQADA